MSLRAALHQLREAEAQLNAGAPRPFPLPARGLEAVIAGGFLGVDQRDWVVPGLRERVGAVLRSCPVERLMDGFAGARPYRVAPITDDPAARMLHACGLAMADPEVAVLCFIGQGSAACGAFHEALNLAALHKLHVIFLAHRWNLDDPDAPVAPQIAGTLAAKALAYGVHARSVDGGLITEVLSAVVDAKAHGGPHLIEAHIERGEDPLSRAYDELTETDPAASQQVV
ncbi:MAG: hypothetical protein H6741_04870 [Alphaproteobacteria bacterium]|nr:hypothetical protein [Alphaproteobacteria bacterium]MCB9792040.1 hypothetical protein [Alphaproteobacteria bacterium]